MIPALTTLLKTATGKVVVGLVVATTGVGAAAAAAVPALTSDPGEEPAEPPADEESVAPEDEATEEETPEDETTEEETPEDETTEDDATEEETTEDDATEEAERPDNHGATVSSFAQQTELEGCAKGQAVAAVARGLDAPTKSTGKCAEADADEVTDADPATARAEAKAQRTAEREAAKAERMAERGR